MIFSSCSPIYLNEENVTLLIGTVCDLSSCLLGLYAWGLKPPTQCDKWGYTLLPYGMKRMVGLR